ETVERDGEAEDEEAALRREALLRFGAVLKCRRVATEAECRALFEEALQPAPQLGGLLGLDLLIPAIGVDDAPHERGTLRGGLAGGVEALLAPDVDDDRGDLRDDALVLDLIDVHGEVAHRALDAIGELAHGGLGVLFP